MKPTLNNIDHIHLSVPNKAEAADWYNKILGFSIDERYSNWNTTTGPLMLKNNSDSIHLALFEAEQYTPISAIAFNTSGENFTRWQERFNQLGIQVRYADHQLSRSLYFNDPFGHQHEITTSDHKK
tara:strand:- start:97 stop:474 length:378 start_codon:yes stop_codon:yes gene_type:complete